MSKSDCIRVYNGKPGDLDVIREYAAKNNLTVSAFIRKLALSEISKHPKNAPIELIVKREVEKILKTIAFDKIRFIQTDMEGDK